VTGETICADLTQDDVGYPSALPGLLDQIDKTVISFLADGAYDGAPIRNLLKSCFDETVEIIIAHFETDTSLKSTPVADWSGKSIGLQSPQPGGSADGSLERFDPRQNCRRGVSKTRRRFSGLNCPDNVLNRMTGLGLPEFEAVT